MATIESSIEAPVQTQPSLSLPTFKNEPVVDFSRHENARKMRDAVESVRAQLGREYDVVIGGQRVKTGKTLTSINPSNPAQVVGVFQSCGQDQVEQAMTAAQKAFTTWSRTPVEQRVELLLKVAKTIRDNRFEWDAWMSFESGKNWAEADADTAETIDFCEFYAREALRLAKAETPIQLPGEHDMLRYIPLGVGAVIPPWNFPSAICVGMAMASVVCGNTVILKPSGDSPTIAAKFFEVLEQCGMPDGVVNFCPGSGGTFGNALVEHPKTRFVAFTGSKEVGLHINMIAAEPRPGQIWIKRAILEMGGKDSILIDADADLDAAVDGVVASAFGFSGQKCSACSRAIIDERVYDKFVERVKSKVEKLTVGPAYENPNMGPVINKGSLENCLRYVGIAKREGGRLITGGDPVQTETGGFFLQPTVIADVEPTATIAQEEIFGPVLAIIKCKSFEDGLRIANNTEFGLTGAVYTSSEEKIERATREFHVGNLYINRKCTGAMVGAHPFGGFNMSGTDSKAGGPDYLYLFSQAKSVARKLS